MFRWTLSLQSNGLRLVPAGGEQAEIRVDLRAPTLAPQLRLPAAKVHADFPGWPAGGVDLPAIVSPNGNPAGTGTSPGMARAWAGLPGFPPVQYRVVNPAIRVRLEGPTVTAVFRAGEIRLRSAGARPDNGKRWFELAAGVPDVAVQANGNVRLPLPSLPSLGDPLKPSRDLCFMTVPAVGWTVLGQVTQKDRDEGLDRCRALNPEPPKVELPSTLNLSLQALL